MKTTIALTLAVAGSAFLTTPAAAQSEATMLAPGITTTPEISARCQRYTRARVTQSGAGDNMRQSVFLACVQKLYNAQYGGGPAPVATLPAAGIAAVTAPVAGVADVPFGMASPWQGYASAYGESYGLCWTDEGFGRIGVCNGVVQ